MNGNFAFSALPEGEDFWLVVAVTSVREVRPQQGKSFLLANARNATGTITLKISDDIAQALGGVNLGLWRLVGRLEQFQGHSQVVVSEISPISVELYRELQNAEPLFPQAFTIDIETIPLPGFRERASLRLKRASESGRMNDEQQQRYSEDRTAEEERAFRSGSLAATSGRVLSIAVHIGPIAGLEIGGIEQTESEHVFGVDSEGGEQSEERALMDFVELMKSFDPEIDEIVGHNVVGFDLPFIFQRCLVNNITMRRFVNILDFNARGVYDTMLQWWLGSRNRVALDDLAWVLGIESSKTDEVHGSRVFELYEAGRLAEIREYNLNDVRVTRKVYERLVAGFGR